jgi:hypothetical protein
MMKVNDLIRNHVTLTVECLDRVYLNGYIRPCRRRFSWSVPGL